MSNERHERAARAEQMRKEREKADRKQRNLITVGIVVVVIALIALGGYGISTISRDSDEVPEFVQPANTTDDFGIVFDAAAAGGQADPNVDPVSVELYEDFQCPICASFEQESGPFLKQQVASGAITVTFRPFSFLDENGGSPNDYSKRSTNAALCVLDREGPAAYVKAHDYLYANQPAEGSNGPENNDLIEAMNGLGFNDLDACIKTERFVPWVKKARAAGQKLGISGTPTVKVAGSVVENPNPQTIQAAISAAAKA